MLATIREAWGWTGLDAVEVVTENEFGNVIVRACDGVFWRICPEILACEIVVQTAEEYRALTRDDAFQLDWQMRRLVAAAVAKLGPLTGDQCYCLKIPAVLGGTYDPDNLGTISRSELISVAGDLAKQIKDLPDGATIKIEIVP